MKEAIKHYLKKVEYALSSGDSTEHTFRPALKELIESSAKGITATNEPKRVACGAPDFIITKGHVPLGYIEAKDIGKSLDEVERSEQMKRYLEGLGNLILTDYLEFRWYADGKRRMATRLAKVGTKGKVQIEKEGEQEFTQLIEAFLNNRIATIGTPKELAVRMAALAHIIRDTIEKAFDSEDGAGSLHEQMEGFRKVLLHNLDKGQFADIYAQTICYGLFTARCNHNKQERFSREHAPYELPKTNPFLRKMFSHIAGPDLDERITWAVDDLAELLAKADIEAILKNFGKRTRQEDPVVHFYETFLSAYDPKMREARGVYYTPEPVVSYIVRSVDQILKTDFKLTDGLADTSTIKVPNPYSKNKKDKIDIHKVLILDPAVGTGTFLHGVVDHIHESFKGNKGMWSGYVANHLLPRLFGFEILMAPYAVAHMKLGLQLAETGYDFQTNERLRVYLTNTLEEAHDMTGLPLFTQWLAEEANAAAQIKRDLPIMVVLGNPPYSNFGMMNKNDWIMELLKHYKKGLNEKKLNLDDDFIKFIRFGQWRIEETGAGILAFITNNTYIDGITHRQMRQSLMETFTDIYILDLHGSSMKREKCPDGSKDENVFDIQQGVAITLFIKKPGKHGPAKVRHAELWGLRNDKYKWLMEQDMASTSWTMLDAKPEHFFFVPKKGSGGAEYDTYRKLTDTFLMFGNGIGTDRDNLFYDYEKASLTRRMQMFFSLQGLEPPFSEEYRVENSSSYKLISRRSAVKFSDENIKQCLYRPFDYRWLYYDQNLTSRPAFNVMQNLVSKNKALLTTRQVSTGVFQHIFVSTGLVDRDPLSLATKERTQVFPLYLYPQTELEKRTGPARRPNLSTEFIKDFSFRLGLGFIPDGKGDLTDTFGPEDVFDYIYALFHSPTYRSRYAEFLKIDFPRLPLTSNEKLFRKLCAIGAELVALHLMEKQIKTVTSYPIPGDNAVDNVRYAEPGQGSEKGRVWINREQYFEGIPPEVWNFHIGGYQVCQKWLKDRKGRKLTYDDLTHYQRIVAALTETIKLMSEIDRVIEEQGGWPIQ